jgi:hypothetical protein
MLVLAGCVLITDEDLAARMAWGAGGADTGASVDGEESVDTGATTSTDTVDSDVETGHVRDSAADSGVDTSVDSAADTTCAGFIVEPSTVEVGSTAGYEEITVTLRGCATGITATTPWATANGGMEVWSTVWVNLPQTVDGEAAATIAYIGDEPTQMPLMSFFASDQGDNDVLTINLY